MSLEAALIHSKSGMLAQGARMNVVASNIASANAESSTVGGAYKAKKIIFSNELDRVSGLTVLKANQVVQSQAPHKMRYDPNSPLSDENGYVHGSNVSVVEEMTDLMSATKSYETNIQVATAVKQLMSKTLQMGK
ncbi:flagellar basal body rod protein FlgC [Pseudoalteromonas marina]|uniref:Flagellar basal-body rod protein FlgC n=1 Tax=Pseudoalteromonas marina TaxID=267375 RepID=A0ABT9FC41_9GAMM|nr:flagellar basal body rod protein FlgC [Pseudoalteromonas marina]MDP2564355.1 flagellar basal body rod protein FlgC [Pseudoalteromonas marina]